MRGMRMADLILREAAIEAAIDGADDWDGGYSPERERYIREHMAKVSAVDAVPVVHARWIDYKDDHQCSACKEHTIVDVYTWEAIQFEFCPYCGAKMDGERRNEDAAN